MSQDDQDPTEYYDDSKDDPKVKEKRREIARRVFEKLRARGIEHVDLDKDINVDEYFEALDEVHKEDFGPDWLDNLVLIESDTLIPLKREREILQRLKKEKK